MSTKQRSNESSETGSARRLRLEQLPSRRLASWLHWVMPWRVAAILRVPLVVKLAGANALIVLAATVAALGVHGAQPRETRMLLIIATALGVSYAVSLALVRLALRPLWAIEATAERVRRGDMEARVEASPIADRDLARVGGTINILLDYLTSYRAGVQRLASQAIGVADRDRSALARELHDSTAQTLAALVLQLTAAANDSKDAELAARLEAIKGLAGAVLEEVHLLARALHPRVLDELGLASALRELARDSSMRSGVEVEVASDLGSDSVATTAASVLYRVAQEAVSNAIRHASPSSVTIRLVIADNMATLTVQDDGSSFDVDEAERRRPGMGLFSMRERVSLVHGYCEILSRPGAGTLVRAAVPLQLQGATSER